MLNGNISGKVFYDTQTSSSEEEHYSYDLSGRITCEITNAGSYEYEYDNYGNRTLKRYVNPDDGTTVDTTYTYNCANQLVSDSDGNTYTYYGNGNMTSVEQNGEMVKYYTYDSFNRLNSAYINGVNLYYTYNGDNLRQTKAVEDESTKHIYDGMNVVADIGNTTNVYLRSGGELVKKHKHNGKQLQNIFYGA